MIFVGWLGEVTFEENSESNARDLHGYIGEKKNPGRVIAVTKSLPQYMWDIQATGAGMLPGRRTVVKY